MKEYSISTSKRNEFIDITHFANDYAKTMKDGIILIFVPHTTAGLTINENADPSVPQDIINFLNKLVPEKGDYKHAEGNSDAHIKTSIIGSSVNAVVKAGKLMLGTWQGIFFCEFDGPRQRKFYIAELK